MCDSEEIVQICVEIVGAYAKNSRSTRFHDHLVLELWKLLSWAKKSMQIPSMIVNLLSEQLWLRTCNRQDLPGRPEAVNTDSYAIITYSFFLKTKYDSRVSLPDRSVKRITTKSTVTAYMYENTPPGDYSLLSPTHSTITRQSDTV